MSGAPEPTALAARVRGGERRALAQAITLVESNNCARRATADALLERLAPQSGGGFRIGISGVPGVGKSTFIEALGQLIVDAGHRLAVLAVDPSSSLRGGSLLGDKTRMHGLANRPEAFIRPSPSGGTLGGVARRTRETILLCEAAGYDVVLVETVGVGQSETAVGAMTDMFVLLLMPGAGDELQGIKRGIMELADLMLINKADGELAAAANRAAADYRNALRLLRPRLQHWSVPVQTCSALDGSGVGDAWNTMERFHRTLSDDGTLESRRAAQAEQWLWDEVGAAMLSGLKRDERVQGCLKQLENDVIQGRLPASVAARRLLAILLPDDNGPQH